MQGQTSITLEFALDRNIDAAAQDVQAAITAALSRLPQGMPSPPSYAKVNPADKPVLYLGLSSPTLPLSQVDEYAETYLAERISMISGVAQVVVYGSQKYAVRIQIDPQALASRGIGIDEVAQAIQSANVNLPTGTLYGSHEAVTVHANGQLTNAAAYRPIIVAYKNGAPVRLEEVGRVLDSVENDKVAGWVGDQRAVVLAIQRQPGTNTVEVVNAIDRILPSFRDQLPASVEITNLYSRADSIQASVADVQFTLLLTVFLVVMVIFLFLRNISATVIPSAALPMSIIGTFAVMWTLGYTVDNLSLLAITLSVGFVVDDAIVMLENIVRHMEMGKGVMEAALDGSREIAFTILSMTFSLAAVFIPVLFLGGIMGRLLHEFAVTIAASILVSGFVSLSLTPMLCSRFLRPPASARHGRLYQTTERAFDWLLDGYRRSLAVVMTYRRATLALALGLLAATFYLLAVIPKGFLPSEDQGQILMFTKAAQGISYDAMVKHQEAIADIIRRDPNVTTYFSSAGATGFSGGGNTGILFAHLKPLGERKLSVDQVMDELRPKLAAVPGIIAFLQNPPPIQIGAKFTEATYQLTLQSPNSDELYKYAQILERKMQSMRELTDVTSDLQISNPQVNVVIDRDKAHTLGISAESIEDALDSAYGERQISTIYAPNDEYQVILEVEPQYMANPATLALLYVRAQGGKLVPLDTIARLAAHPGTARDQPFRPAHRGHHLVQRRARRLAWQGARRRKKARQRHRAGHHQHRLPGHRRGVPVLDAQPGNPAGDGDPGHLHRVGRALRELHPSGDNSLGAAGGRLRRAAHADDLSHGARPAGLRWHHHAGRPGEEKRHHDDRLRTRRPAHRGQEPGRGDLRGQYHPLPADYDDHDVGADGHAADRLGHGRRRRLAPPAGRGGRGRTVFLAIAHAVHHARHLYLHGVVPRLGHQTARASDGACRSGLTHSRRRQADAKKNLRAVAPCHSVRRPSFRPLAQAMGALLRGAQMRDK